MVLHRDGEGEPGRAARRLPLVFADQLLPEAVVRGPGALVAELGEILPEGLIVQAEIVVDALAVVEPALARVHEPAAVALLPEDPRQGGHVFVHHPQG